MKKLIFFTLIAVTGHLANAQVSGGTDYTSTSATEQKYGFVNNSPFTPNTNCPDIPEYFANSSYTENETVTTIGTYNYSASAVNTNGTIKMTAESGTATYNNGYSATATLSGGWTSGNEPGWGTMGGYASSGLNYCVGDSYPYGNMLFGMCDDGWSYWDDGTGTSDSTDTTADWGTTLSTNQTGNAIAGSSSITWTLSGKVPDSALFNPFPDQGNPWTAGGGSPAGAAIAPTADSASYTGARARFEITANGLFTIPIVMDINMGGVDMLTTNNLSGYGDGTPQYFPSADGFLLNPPYASWTNGECPNYLGGSPSLSSPGANSISDGKDNGDKNLPGCGCGMPSWWVSEPFINLWVADKPDEYSTSLGEKEAFAVYYRQNASHGQVVDAQNPFVQMAGWNNNWSSFVHLTAAQAFTGDGSFLSNDFTSWSAQLFERGGGERDFAWNQTKDADSGEQLLPIDGISPLDNPGIYGATGFRLVHPDGSQDIYGILTTTYPTNVMITMPVFENGNSTEVPVGTLHGIHYLLPVYYTPVQVANTADFSNDMAATAIHIGNSCPPPPASGGYQPSAVICGYYTNMTISMPVPPAIDALMTEHIDPYGNSTHLYYTTNRAGLYLLSSIVDYDGKTTTINYDTNNLLVSVQMPYGHTSYFSCSTNGQIMSITDAQGMTSTFGYDTSNNVTSMTTPYGTTSFASYNATPGIVSLSNNGVARAIRITNPDSSHELYAYYNSNPNCAPAQYTGVVPTADRVSFDTGSTSNPTAGLNSRDSFYWGRAQCASLSTTAPSLLDTLTAGDFNLGRMKHWMLQSDGSGGNILSSVPSSEREPSPNGTASGQWIWFSGPAFNPFELPAGVPEVIPGAFQLLPDGSTYSETYSYDSTFGQYEGIATYGNGAYDTKLNYSFTPTTYGYSCTVGGVNIVHTTWNAETLSQVFGVELPQKYINYGNDYTQTVTETATNGSTVSTLSLTAPEPPDTIQDPTGRWTVSYNNRAQVSGYKLDTGLIVTNFYGTNNFLSQSIALQIPATNTYVFSNGLPLTWTDPLGRTTGYTWDGLERLTGILYPDGTTASNVYNNLDLVGQKDRLSYWTYAQFNNMRQKLWSSDKNGNVTQYGYCLCGGVDSIIDPMTNSITLSREMDGRVMAEVFADTDSHTITRTLGRNAIGEMTSLADSTGVSLQYTYDDIGRMTGVLCGGTNLYGTSYNPNDEPSLETNADGSVFQDVFDGAGRLQSRVLLADGITWTATYDSDNYPSPHNNLLGYSPYGTFSTSLNPAGWVTNSAGPGGTRGYAYNAAGQIQSMCDGDGHVTTWTYDKYGNQISKEDGNGVVVETNGYDAEGRVVTHWTPAKGLTQYTWDGNGNLTSVSNPGGPFNPGVTNTYAYDALNRLTGMNDVLGSTTFGYRSFGAFMSARSSEDGPWPSDTVSGTFTGWVRTSMTEAQPAGSWAENYTYDSLLRLKGVSSVAGSFAYSYNGLGQEVTGLSLPGGSSITNAYDDSGLELSTALLHGSSVLDSDTYTYDGFGKRTSVTRADNSFVNYGYGWYDELTSAQGYEADGVTLRENENLTYGYDSAWNLTSRGNDQLTQTFTVDGANELTGVSRGETMTVMGSLSNSVSGVAVNGQSASLYGDNTFAVEGINLKDGLNLFTNVLSVSGHSYTNVQAQTLPAATTLVYDANGNLVWDGLKGYGYDYANELTSVTVTNQWRVTYAYDGLGRRRVMQSYTWGSLGWLESAPTRYVYDGNVVVQERDQNNNLKVIYVWGKDLSGQRGSALNSAGGIGGLLEREDANGTAYYHADGNGNVTAMVNSSGALVAKYLYDPYGNMLGMWGSLAPTNTYRFSSKEMDLHSGLYYFGARYYDPNFQRWINRDPIAERGGLNLYDYVDNGPVNEIDRFGLQADEDFDDWLDVDSLPRFGADGDGYSENEGRVRYNGNSNDGYGETIRMANGETIEIFPEPDITPLTPLVNQLDMTSDLMDLTDEMKKNLLAFERQQAMIGGVFPPNKNCPPNEFPPSFVDPIDQNAPPNQVIESQ